MELVDIVDTQSPGAVAASSQTGTYYLSVNILVDTAMCSPQSGVSGCVLRNEKLRLVDKCTGILSAPFTQNAITQAQKAEPVVANGSVHTDARNINGFVRKFDFGTAESPDESPYRRGSCPCQNIEHGWASTLISAVVCSERCQDSQ